MAIRPALPSVLLALATFAAVCPSTRGARTIPEFSAKHGMQVARASSERLPLALIEFGPHTEAVQVRGGISAFTVEVQVGSPSITYELILDTASALTWLGAGRNYVRTASSQQVAVCPSFEDPVDIFTGGCQFSIAYLFSGRVSGQVYRDTVALGPGLVASKGLLGVAESASGFNGVDGVLGLGPEPYAVNSELAKEGVTSTATFSTCLNPGANGGTLFMGGVPTTPLGQPYSLTFTSLTESTAPYYSIPKATDVLLNGSSIEGVAAMLQSESEDWLVDVGTTLTYFGDGTFNAILSALTSYTKCNYRADSNSGLTVFDLTSCNDQTITDPYARFPVLAIKLQGTVAVARPQSYLIPPNKNNEFGISGNVVGLLMVSDPNDRVIGQAFLTDNLVVFDNDNHRVGFTPVQCASMAPLEEIDVGQLLGVKVP